ncbi:hypothetical protein Tco_0973761 [Tanacetum coccineum]|uniref:Uncharacterized protein n=1 Tax=Tanacetum coccineum TaxID=301880 RepID=A0ABQ5E9Q9_9ASTR
MNSPPNNKSEQSLNIDDSDLRPAVVFRPYNNHHKRRQTTTTTQTLVSSQNPKFDNCAEKLFRIMPCHAGIVQATKLCKIADIREGGQEGIVSGCSGGINFFCNDGKLDKVVAVVKSSTSNALVLVNVFYKDDGSSIGKQCSKTKADTYLRTGDLVMACRRSIIEIGNDHNQVHSMNVNGGDSSTGHPFDKGVLMLCYFVLRCVLFVF